MNNDPYHTETVVCLFDGSYNLGIAALINSLFKADFKGLVYAGYRGSLPFWTTQLRSLGNDKFQISSQIAVHFTKVETEMHLGYFKPYFIKQTFETFRETKRVYFFDADIVLQAPWSIFSNWLEKGVCLCLDSAFHFVHYNHPWRKEWRHLSDADQSLYNSTNCYYNSGFMGIERDSSILLDRWIDFTEKYKGMGGDIYNFVKDTHSSFKGDQDLMNAAITTSSDVDISAMGKEAMGFTLPATLMMHAIGDNGKPWNKYFTRHLLRSGHGPNLAEKGFFSHCKHPIRIFPEIKYRLKRLDLKFTSLLAHFVS